MNRLLRADLQDRSRFPAPQSGEPTRQVSQAMKADANENPYGCPPQALEALRSVSPHRYPDASYTCLRQALAAYAHVDSAQVVVGNGADELIDLTLRACLEPGETVLNFPPTFGIYDFFTHLNRGRVRELPRDDQFAVPLPGALEAASGSVKAIFVCSPNNPTGAPLPEADLLALLDTGRLVVADETYFEFCGQTAVPWLQRYPNLIVLRSLSKWAGLAGLRLGYALAAPPLADLLNGIRSPYNVNVAAEAAALACLRHAEQILGGVRRLVEERERLCACLERQGTLRPLPSQGNYLLCFLPQGDADSLRRALAGEGVLLRWYDTPRLRRAVRVSVGRPEDSDLLLAALARWSDGQ
ncbi:MAG: histidinol-phosphate transaminase [Chloroflexi bacterium]|nr:histidinol-phosphate transaminase [Chloroflexota bacterium]